MDNLEKFFRKVAAMTEGFVLYLFVRALPILMLCFSGCGTIRDIGSEEVTIAGPAATHIRLVDSSERINSYPIQEADNRLTATFDTDGVLLFVMRVEGEEPDSTILSSNLDAWAIISNLMIFFPIGHTVDAASGSQYRFDRSVVWFQEEVGRDSAVITVYDITNDMEIKRTYRIGDAGIVLGLHLGLRFPKSRMANVNDVGFTLGYRIVDPLVLVYHGGWAGFLKYGDVPGITMDIERSAHTIDARYALPFLSSDNRSTGFYAVAGFGIARFEEEALRSGRTNDSIPQSAIDVTMPTIGFGGGYATQGAFWEIRREFGLSNIPIRTESGNQIQVPVQNFVFRCGLNMEL